MDNYKFNLDAPKRELKITIHVAKFDALHAVEFKELLEKTWSDQIESVVIDVDKVDFIDSSGIGALLGVQKRIHHTGKPIVIQSAQEHVQEIISLLRLQRIFTLQ